MCVKRMQDVVSCWYQISRIGIKFNFSVKLVFIGSNGLLVQYLEQNNVYYNNSYDVQYNLPKPLGKHHQHILRKDSQRK